MTNPIKDIEHASTSLSLKDVRVSKKNLSPESIKKIEQMCAERGLLCIHGFNNNLRISGTATEVEIFHKDLLKRMQPSKTAQTLQRGAQAVKQATQEGVQAAQKVIQQGVQVARTAGAQAETMAVVAAGKGVKAITKVGKGGLPFMAFMAAVDPNGTQKFIDDIFHLRVGKIATDMYEGGKQIVLHPVDTITEIANTVADKTSDYYAGTKDGTDFAKRTAMIPVHGINNIGKTMAHAGNYEWGLVGSFRDSERAGINWVMNACGFDTEIVREGTSIRDFQQDPFKFFYNISVLGLLNPTTRDKTTGLRSDDDFNSIIFRGDTKAFEAYLKTGVDVNKYIAGAHDRGSHPYPTAFALSISEGQFDMANMLLDNKGTYINQQNEVTKDTPLMSAIAYTALDEYSVAYFTGKPDMSKATPEAQAKFAKANALILKMIQDNRLEIEATNNFGETAFLTAAGCGNIAAMTALAEKGANIHHTNTWGETALHVACCNQLMTYSLLEMGLDANAKDKDGNTPLMTALEKNAERGGKNDMVVCLLLGEMNTDGLTALHASEKHSQLFNNWVESYPQVKEIIMTMENHPLNKDKKFIGQQTQTGLRKQLAQISEKQPTTTEIIPPETGITR